MQCSGTSVHRKNRSSWQPSWGFDISEEAQAGQTLSSLKLSSGASHCMSSMVSSGIACCFVSGTEQPQEVALPRSISSRAMLVPPLPAGSRWYHAMLEPCMKGLKSPFIREEQTNLQASSASFLFDTNRQPVQASTCNNFRCGQPDFRCGNPSLTRTLSGGWRQMLPVLEPVVGVSSGTVRPHEQGRV